MLSKIVPVKSSFSFGLSDTLFLRGVSDNLTDSAVFFWQLGRTVDDVFTGDPSAVGNVTLDGEQYADWSGENSALPPLLAPKIGVTLVE